MQEVLENWSATIHPWLWNLLITVAAIVIGLIIKLIIKGVLTFYKNRTDYSLFRSIIIHTGRPLNHFVPLLILNLMFPLMELGKKFYGPLSKIVQILLMISFAALLISAIKVFEDYMYHIYDLNKTDNLKERKIRTQLQFIRRVIVSIVVILTIAAILLSFENVRKIGAGLLTGVGIGGIIIGFAAQKSLGNFLAGFQIAFTQPIRIDDVLVVENEWGKVEDITLTYVVMNLWDQRRLILPITYFIEKPFQNWTRVSADLLGAVMLYLDYNAPIEEMRKEFDRLMESSPLWDKRVKVVQVTDAKERSLEVRMLVSAQNSGNLFDLRCYIRENMVKFIRDNYPQSLPMDRVLLSPETTVQQQA
ncbi:mechanosensitive ion channel [Mucilaginibacter limnophilus]|uniref:Mechanosensitive ion channel n=1 Tax=Mucilaginibacter limnophilus TaxID=1932778 RepID=A0A3S2ULV9_9SPHI|nr:mechanosensitive ion channel domain-containing protein [Mucilaginibacter limnophilus]RVU01471.1 mechanosensitive ion channel [Mucilaginibacter limnophilus]